MLPEAKALQLIAVYYYVSEQFETELHYSVQRFSNNTTPSFTDVEVMTLYLFVMQQEQRFDNKHIYTFARHYLLTWFPRLPSYQAFNHRLNRLCCAFQVLTARLLQQFQPVDTSTRLSLIDSMPIQTCSGKRKGRVAKELTDKGYCSTKGKYYYGLKLHVLGLQRRGTVPFAEHIALSAASENDLNILEQNWSTLQERIFIGDKIYHDRPLHQQLWHQQKSSVLTPVKKVKNKAAVLVQHDQAADDLFSKAVSSLRQPIESLFNWLIEKTNLQNASKVRSANGLLVHVFARLAAAYSYLIFNS
ncbi:MAG: IS4/IS5 family transposase [Hymenobacter sp.]|nr:MAG: IS4/IS5 family transposase [Hymenobacter sp.]